MWFEAKFEGPSNQSYFWYCQSDDLKWFKARFEGRFDQFERILSANILLSVVKVKGTRLYYSAHINSIETTILTKLSQS